MLPWTFSDKLNPDIDFINEAVVQSNVSVAKILLQGIMIYKWSQMNLIRKTNGLILDLISYMVLNSKQIDVFNLVLSHFCFFQNAILHKMWNLGFWNLNICILNMFQKVLTLIVKHLEIRVLGSHIWNPLLQTLTAKLFF